MLTGDMTAGAPIAADRRLSGSRAWAGPARTAGSAARCPRTGRRVGVRVARLGPRGPSPGLGGGADAGSGPAVPARPRLP